MPLPVVLWLAMHLKELDVAAIVQHYFPPKYGQKYRGLGCRTSNVWLTVECWANVVRKLSVPIQRKAWVISWKEMLENAFLLSRNKT